MDSHQTIFKTNIFLSGILEIYNIPWAKEKILYAIMHTTVDFTNMAPSQNFQFLFFQKLKKMEI